MPRMSFAQCSLFCQCLSELACTHVERSQAKGPKWRQAGASHTQRLRAVALEARLWPPQDCSPGAAVDCRSWPHGLYPSRPMPFAHAIYNA